jgi:hypothetical protein
MIDLPVGQNHLQEPTPNSDDRAAKWRATIDEDRHYCFAAGNARLSGLPGDTTPKNLKAVFPLLRTRSSTAG